MERVLKSKYKITDRLFEDDASATYKGKNLTNNRSIIVKIFKRSILDGLLIKNLHKKVTDLSKVDHPNAAAVFDGDYGWQGFYFVRDYVEGEDLWQYLKDQKILSPDQIINIAVQICDAVSAAHKKDVIHGALKPSNIIIFDDKKLKVTDFGIESAVRATYYQRADMIYKDARFMSPEEISGVFNKKSSDIFKMGLILYLLTAGQLPFGGENGLKLALKYMNENIVSPSSKKQNTPKFLDGIIMKALQKDTLLRFSTIDELGSSLKARGIVGSKSIDIDASKINFDNAPEPVKEAKATVVKQGKKLLSIQAKVFEKKITLAVILAIIAGIVYAFIQVFIGR